MKEGKDITFDQFENSLSYISKTQKGMSELLCRACAEVKEGNANIKQQVCDIWK